MTVNDYNDQVVTSAAAAQLDVVYLMVLVGEQINIASGVWDTAIYLANVLFSICLQKEAEKQFAFTWDREEYAFG